MKSLYQQVGPNHHYIIVGIDAVPGRTIIYEVLDSCTGKRYFVTPESWMVR